MSEDDATSLARPRLLPHVLPRRHMSGTRRLVVLHDTDRLENHQVAERTWTVLSGMDGTRDVEGLAAFASREGARASVDEIRELVAQLAQQGMVSEGVPRETDAAGPARAPAASSGRVAPADEAPRPLLHLPGFMLDCDGSGTCCRFYPSIAFSPLDAAAARSRLPQVADGGMHPERVFLPLLGNAAGMFAVALVDGRCSYLQEDLACGIHRAGCAGDKPLGCRTYPARFVDDGAQVRVAPWLECSCVFRSGVRKEPRGEPLIATRLRSAADLDRALHLERLPEEIVIADGRRCTRAELVAWSDALARVPVRDGVASLLSLSLALRDHGVDIEASRAALTCPAPPELVCFDAALQAVGARLQKLTSEHWRADRDMARITAVALYDASLLARELGDELLASPGRFAEVEQFYVHTLLFGHQLVHMRGLRSMSMLALDRAVRALLGRALAVVANLAGLEDPAFQWPLALVEATMRGYGVGAYMRDVVVEDPP